jgi:hypothetical protein
MTPCAHLTIHSRRWPDTGLPVEWFCDDCGAEVSAEFAAERVEQAKRIREGVAHG